MIRHTNRDYYVIYIYIYIEETNLNAINFFPSGVNFLRKQGGFSTLTRVKLG